MPDIPINNEPIASGAGLTDKVLGIVSNATKLLTLQAVRDLGNNVEVNHQTGSYTLQASDHGKVVEMESATAVTLTVPSGLPAKFTCVVIQVGAGLVTFAEGSGTTINGTLSMGGQNTSAYIYQRLSANTFMLLTGGSSSGTTTGGGGSGATQLPAPTLNSPSVISSTELDLTWTNVSSAAGYLLQLDTSNAFGAPVTAYNGSALSDNNTGLSAATTYYYRVKVLGNGTTTLDSAWSNVVNGTTSAGGGSSDFLTPYNNPGAITYQSSHALQLQMANKQALYQYPTNNHIATNGSNGTSFFTVAFVKFAADPLTQGDGTVKNICGVDNDLTKNGSEWYLYYWNENSAPHFTFQVEDALAKSQGESATTWFASLPLNPAYFDINQWFCVVGWYDFTAKTVNIWVNGQTASGPGPTNPNYGSTAPFVVGAVGADNNTVDVNGNSWFNGDIKSIGLFRRLPASGDFTSLANFTNILNQNNGTITAGAWVADAPSVFPAGTNSWLGAVNTASKITFNPYNIGVGTWTQGISYSFWFKATSFGGFVLCSSPSPDSYIRILDSTHIRVAHNSGSGDYKDFAVPTMNTGTWYHVIVTVAANGATNVYLNNVASTSGQQALTDMVYGLNLVGAYGSGDSFTNSTLAFDGNLSDIRVFTKVISSGDRAAILANTATSANPVTWFKLSDGAGTTAADAGYLVQPVARDFAQLPSSYQTDSALLQWYDLKETTGNRAGAK